MPTWLSARALPDQSPPKQGLKHVSGDWTVQFLEVFLIKVHQNKDWNYNVTGNYPSAKLLPDQSPPKQGLKPVVQDYSDVNADASWSKSTKTRIETTKIFWRNECKETSWSKSTKTRIETFIIKDGYHEIKRTSWSKSTKTRIETPSKCGRKPASKKLPDQSPPKQGLKLVGVEAFAHAKNLFLIKVHQNKDWNQVLQLGGGGCEVLPDQSPPKQGLKPGRQIQDLREATPLPDQSPPKQGLKLATIVLKNSVVSASWSKSTKTRIETRLAIDLLSLLYDFLIKVHQNKDWNAKV